MFTPDRLAVVKGGPAARRAYFDRSLGRLFPARADAVRSSTAPRVAQRNAALRRVAAGPSARDALAPWTAARGLTGQRARRCPARARSRCSQPALRASAPASSASPDARARLRRGAAHDGGSSQRGSQRDLERGGDGARAPPGRRRRPLGRRATSGSSARRESSALAVLSLLLAEAELADRAARRAAAAAARRRPLRARRRPPPRARRADRRRSARRSSPRPAPMLSRSSRPSCCAVSPGRRRGLAA